MTVTVDLPPEVLSSLRRSPEDFVRDMRVAAAVHWYSRGKVSQGRAAELAGMTRADFIDELARQKVDVVQVSIGELAGPDGPRHAL